MWRNSFLRTSHFRLRTLEGCVFQQPPRAPLSVVGSIMGWSSATTVRMVKRYGHIGQDAQCLAVEVLDPQPVAWPDEVDRIPSPQLHRLDAPRTEECDRLDSRATCIRFID